MNNCPKCQSVNIRKAGLSRNKQRYNCKDCNYFFTIDSIKSKEIDPELLKVTYEAFGLVNGAKELGISTSNFWQRLTQSKIKLKRKNGVRNKRVRKIQNRHVEITTIIPKDVLSGIKSNYNPEEDSSKSDHYFWNTFQKDLEALADYCHRITLNIDFNNNLEIKLYLNLMTNQHFAKNQRVPLKYRDMRLILNFIYRIYNDFYIIWL